MQLKEGEYVLFSWSFCFDFLEDVTKIIVTLLQLFFAPLRLHFLFFHENLWHSSDIIFYKKLYSWHSKILRNLSISFENFLSDAWNGKVSCVDLYLYREKVEYPTKKLQKETPKNNFAPINPLPNIVLFFSERYGSSVTEWPRHRRTRSSIRSASKHIGRTITPALL